ASSRRGGTARGYRFHLLVPRTRCRKRPLTLSRSAGPNQNPHSHKAKKTIIGWPGPPGHASLRPGYTGIHCRKFFRARSQAHPQNELRVGRVERSEAQGNKRSPAQYFLRFHLAYHVAAPLNWRFTQANAFARSSPERSRGSFIRRKLPRAR